MKNLLTIICAILLFVSCVESNEDLIADEKKMNLLEINGIDSRASKMLNQKMLSKDLDNNELFQVYKEMSDIEDDYEKLNSKNMVLHLLDKNGFTQNADLNQIEYLIVDQASLKSNILTLDVNVKLFHRAKDLNSKIDLNSYLSSFQKRNMGLVNSHFAQDDNRRQQFYLNCTLLNAKINLGS